MNLIWQKITGALLALSMVLVGLLRYVSNQRREATERADRERETREVVTNVAERKRKVDDDVRSTSADDRRDRLRKYSTSSRDD